MLFYELIQVALGQREQLSHVPSEQEWQTLFSMAKKQAVVGLAFEAIDKLSRQGQKPQRKVLLKWYAIAQKIKSRNEHLDNRCGELLTLLAKHGIKASILKGQGIAGYYDSNLKSLRQNGDIDVFVDGGMEKAMAFAKGEGQKNIEWDYKHLQLTIWNDVEVEMHYRVEVLLNLKKNKKLQRWFADHKDLMFSEIDGLTTPNTEFNVFYILLHAYRHFLYEGVGLRQIIDYYFVLKANANGKTPAVALDAMESLGMEKFAKGLMWLMQEVLGLSRQWMLWEPDEKEGKYILEQVMQGGNFGHHDNRLTYKGGKMGTIKAICRHNWHLVSHYPQEIIWSPIWFVYHKCWKMAHKRAAY